MTSPRVRFCVDVRSLHSTMTGNTSTTLFAACLTLLLGACPEPYDTDAGPAGDAGAAADADLRDGASPRPDAQRPDGLSLLPAVAHIIDVGQGDSSLFVTRSGLRVLVDCGSSSKAVNYLLDRLGPGAAIDALVITHPDADHVGACKRIIEQLKVGWIFTNGRLEQCGTQTCSTLVATLKGHKQPGACFNHMKGEGGQCKVQKDTSITISRAGVNTRLDFVVTYDTDPGLQGTEYHDWDGHDRNNASLMVRIHEGGLRFFFPGDCDRACQQQVQKSGTLASVTSEVSLVPHHCRLTGYEPPFAKATGTEVKVISTGSQLCVRKACLDLAKQTSKQLFLTNECEGKNKLRYSQTVRVKTPDGKTLQVEAQKPVDPWGD